MELMIGIAAMVGTMVVNLMLQWSRSRRAKVRVTVK
jgi:hypothetical protein